MLLLLDDWPAEIPAVGDPYEVIILVSFCAAPHVFIVVIGRIPFAPAGAECLHIELVVVKGLDLRMLAKSRGAQVLGEVLANTVMLSGSPLGLCDCMVWSSGPLCLRVEQVGTYQSPQLFVLSVPVAESQVILHKFIVLGGQGR